MTSHPLEVEFTEYRPRLLGIAYRILGSAWDAEDVVADAMIRWMDVDHRKVREPLAFLTTVVTRLAIDQLRSARATRETYVGEWLPEPVATDPTRLGPLDTVERRETMSLATLRMMEALTPPERAVLVLHEAFGMTHAEIGETIGVSEAGARQHLRRARLHLDRDPEHAPTVAHDEALDRFLAALEDGDLERVQDLLAADVASYSDGGGRARAARRPVVGAKSVVQFIEALRRHLPVRDVRRVDVNGQAAATLWFGRQFTLLALDVRNDEIQEIHWIMNPRKLRYLNHQLAEAPGPAQPANHANQRPSITREGDDPMTTETLTGWDINEGGTGDWVDWGDGERARAKVLASGDGYLFVLVEADTGYVGTPHEHTNPEFSYVLSGRLRNQGRIMEPGGAYVAATGSQHDDFEALEPSTYLNIFKI